MVKLPSEFEAGSPYSMKVDQLDSATRFASLLIEMAIKAIKLLEEGKWNEAERDIVQILRALNRENINFQHIRQMVRGRRLEKQLIAELERLSKDGKRLYADYIKIKRSKGRLENSHYKDEVEWLLKDIAGQENLTRKVIASFKRHLKRSHGVFYAGVNAGGTSTRCVITDENGKELGRTKEFVGPANMRFGFYNAINVILKALRSAVEDWNPEIDPKSMYFRRMCMEIELKEAHQRYGSIFSKYIRRYSPNIQDVVVLPDNLVAWYAGFGGAPGILVIGGTATYVYGFYKGIESHLDSYYNKTRIREVILVAGRRMSFFGAKLLSRLIKLRNKTSMVSILRRGVINIFKKRKIFRSTLPSLRKIPRESILLYVVEDAFRRKKIFKNSRNLFEAVDAIAKNYPRDPSTLTSAEVGSLTPYLIEAAEKGDKDSLKIIRKASNNVGVIISEVATELGLHNKSFMVTYSGGVISHPFVLHHFKNELKDLERKAKVISKPVIGEEMDALIKIARENIHFY